ncbi:hypothetical protein HZA87_00715 [Candidatus Uhrbacteria bacterium]|nr:hypothetical protein [Candidatus Uhrbacteria bacterium]
MDKALEHLLGTVVQMRKDEEGSHKEEDVIKVSDTVSVAASVYETVRNTLEYDDEHLLRRNAIRRILKRRIGESSSLESASKLLQELIWARYLPNGRVPTNMIGKIGTILEKVQFLFATLDPESPEGARVYPWLLDVLSVEVEYVLGPPCIDEALASFAYQELKKRVDWQTKLVKEADRDLQLYIAIHRNVLKSNRATLRYRILTLYYPLWRKAKQGDPVVKEIAMQLVKVVDSVENQIDHPAQDAVYRFVRRHGVVFHLLADIARDNPEAFARSIATGDIASIDTAITKAAKARYNGFRSKLMRTVVRAALFLLLTKSILAVLVELPYELFVLHSTDYLPLTVNILFPPVLLTFIGVTVRIPKKENTAKILDEVHGILGVGDDFSLVFKRRRPWERGALYWIFNGLYLAVLLVTLSFIILTLHSFHFNVLSIAFFLFFLSLVAYFGLRIRNTKRELLVLETHRGFLGTIVDILTLPIVRAGRWVALRAPRVNIFLFFFDFIIEAPFKAAIGIIESWLGFLREKREEI